MAETIRIWRIYTAEDGKSRLQPIDVPMTDRPNGVVSKLFSGSGVQINRTRPDRSAAWHTAPRRQLIATISGEGEIETGDGQVLVTKAGVIHLVEDTTGQGHITRGRGNEERVALFMPLADDETFV